MIQAYKIYKNRKGLLEDVLAVIIGIGVIIFTVLLTKSVRTLDGDNCPQTYALFVDVARAIHNKELSLWLPYLWGGVPNIGNFITEAFYPINWILCSLFYDSTTELVSYAIIPWNLIIHCSIYFIGLYSLVKKIGFSRLNAFATSMTSTLCCAIFFYRVWIVYLDGFCYLPLIILFATMLYDAENKLPYSLILSALFAIEASISMSLMLVLSVFIFGMLFIAYLFGNKRTNILYNLGYSVLTGILAILLVAPLLFSTLTFTSNMVRYVPDVGFVGWGVKIPISEYTKYRYRWPDFLHMIQFTNSDIGISISAFVLLFCIIGFFCKKKSYKRLWYVSLIGITICGMASFGIVFPVAFYYVPGLNQLREAYMYGILLNLFASILASWGFNSVEKIILEKVKLKEQFRFIIPCGIILFCLFCYNALSKNITCILFIVLTVILIMLVLIRPAKLRRLSFCVCTLLFVGLCGKDLFQTINVYMYTELEAIKQVETICENTRELVEYIDGIDPPDEYYRMTAWGSLPVIPTNMSSVLGYYDVVSYLNPTLVSGIDLHLRLPLEQRAQLQNIKYFLVNAEDELIIDMFNSPNYIKAGEINHVFTDYSGINEGTVYIYQALCNLGDAWISFDPDWNNSNTRQEVLDLIAVNAVDVYKTAIIDECPITETEHKDLYEINPYAEKSSVICRNVSNNSLIYDVDSESSGILVTTELYYPGWQVFVNGEQRTLLKVDGTNRGVIVPSGTSTVEFRFRPVGYQAGITLQFLAIATVVFTEIRHYRKRKKGIYEKEKSI